MLRFNCFFKDNRLNYVRYYKYSTMFINCQYQLGGNAGREGINIDRTYVPGCFSTRRKPVIDFLAKLHQFPAFNELKNSPAI